MRTVMFVVAERLRATRVLVSGGTTSSLRLCRNCITCTFRDARDQLERITPSGKISLGSRTPVVTTEFIEDIGNLLSELRLAWQHVPMSQLQVVEAETLLL